MASGQRLLVLLAAMERGLSTPAANAAQARALFTAACEANNLAQRHASIMQASPSALIRQVVAIARRMAPLDAALCSSGALGGAAGHFESGSEAAADQVSAACVAMQAACLIVQTLQLQPSTAPSAADVRELVAGLVIVLSSGRALLEACCMTLLSAAPGSEAARLAGKRLTEIANQQMVATNSTFGAIRGVAGGGVEGSTAVTQAFPSWLVSLSRTLMLCHERNGGEPFGIRLWAAFGCLARQSSQLMQPAVSGSPACQQAVVEVLLGCCLPALEAECEAAHSSGRRVALSAMAHTSGHAAHAELVSARSNESAVAQHALLTILPAVLEDRGPFYGVLRAHLAQQPRAARAAARIVAALPERPAAGEDAAADWLEGHQYAAQLLHVLLRMRAAPAAVTVQSAQWHEQLQLVPRIVAVIRQLSFITQPGEASDAVRAAHTTMTYSLVLMHAGKQAARLQQSSSPMFASPADVARWAAAAEAALRVVPQLLAPKPTWPDVTAEALQHCASSLLCRLWDAPSSKLRAWAQQLLDEVVDRPALQTSAPPAAADAVKAAAQLWQLQRTASCALHYLAAEGRLAVLGLVDSTQTWGHWLAVFSMQFVTAHICMQLAWGGSRGMLSGVAPLGNRAGSRRIQALCSNMWAVVLLMAGTPGRREALLNLELLPALTGILGELADSQGFAVADMLHRVLQPMITSQASRSPAERQALLDVLYTMALRGVSIADDVPWVAAALADSGVLAQFVAVGRIRSQTESIEEMVQENWAGSTAVALAALKRCAHETLNKLAGGAELPPASEVAAQLRAALAALETATSWLEELEAALHSAMPPSLPGAGGPSHVMRYMHMGFLLARRINDDALRCAAQLGTVLRRYQQLPAQQEAAQVQLALAAAAHGCSNLACANLEGARARELDAGKHNQRCSGCRVARYCCAACQAEDWKRGGHRRVCRLLRAARAAEGEQPA